MDREYSVKTTVVKEGNRYRSSIRKIHINLPEKIHQKLRVKCAVEDVSMQEFVAHILASAVEDVKVSVNPPDKKK